MWILKTEMGLTDDTEDKEKFFREGCQPTDFKLRPYQQAQARLSTGAGGLGLPPAVMRRFSASRGNLVSTLPAVNAGLNGMPKCTLVARMGDRLSSVSKSMDYRKRF